MITGGQMFITGNYKSIAKLNLQTGLPVTLITRLDFYKYSLILQI